MTDPRELYQELILHHGRSPRNQGVVEPASHTAVGHNPLCGDKIRLTLRVEDGVVQEARFTGEGCAISTASSSLMTDRLRGERTDEALRLLRSFSSLVAGSPPPASGESAPLGKLEAFAGVRDFPVRVKCAMLPWRTLEAALQERESASTE